MTAEEHYPNFNYEASKLSAFMHVLDTFIISLKNGKVVQHVPDDGDKFERWLLGNNVRNVN